METQQTNNTWLEAESSNLNTNTQFGEKLPSLKFEEENKPYEIIVDFSNPFNKWTEPAAEGKKAVTKAIIPVTKEGVKLNWWLNKKNPAYQQLIKLGKEGQTTFKIMRTGTQANTKYIFVK